MSDHSSPFDAAGTEPVARFLAASLTVIAGLEDGCRQLRMEVADLDIESAGTVMQQMAGMAQVLGDSLVFLHHLLVVDERPVEERRRDITALRGVAHHRLIQNKEHGLLTNLSIEEMQEAIAAWGADLTVSEPTDG